VATTDETIGVSHLHANLPVGAYARAAPPKSTPMHAIKIRDFKTRLVHSTVWNRYLG